MQKAVRSEEPSKKPTPAVAKAAKEARPAKQKPTPPAWMALQRLTPALKRVLSPERGNIWFDKDRAFAVGAYMGMEVPFTSKLQCGVSGDRLLKLLDSTASEPKLQMEDDTLVVSWGQSCIEMPAMATERSKGIWKLPATPPKGAVGWVLTKELLAAFERISNVRAQVPSSVLHQGIVALPNKQGLDLYATNSVTLGKTSVAMEMPRGELAPLIFPYELVDVMLQYCQPGDKLFLLPDSLAVYGATVNIFIGRLDADEATLRRIAAPIKEFAGVKDTAAIPALLGSVLDRAQLLASKSDKTVADAVTLSSNGEELEITGKLAFGRLSEVLPCNLPKQKVHISASRLASVLNGIVKEMALVNNKETAAIVLTGKDTTFVVAGVRSK